MSSDRFIAFADEFRLHAESRGLTLEQLANVICQITETIVGRDSEVYRTRCAEMVAVVEYLRDQDHEGKLLVT